MIKAAYRTGGTRHGLCGSSVLIVGSFFRFQQDVYKRQVYKRYYPAKQLDTLVEELQSADAIEEDIDNDVNYFLAVSYTHLRHRPVPDSTAWC